MRRTALPAFMRGLMDGGDPRGNSSLTVEVAHRSAVSLLRCLSVYALISE